MSSNEFKAALRNADNLEEFFAICGKFYDLKGSKLGIVAKGMLIQNIDKVIAVSGAKPKK